MIMTSWSLTIGVSLLVRFGSVPIRVRSIIFLSTIDTTLRFPRESVTTLLEESFELEIVCCLLEKVAWKLKTGDRTEPRRSKCRN